MTFDSMEASIEDSAPREGIEIKHGVKVYRIATGSRDVRDGGTVYTASAAERGTLEVLVMGDERNLSLSLPTAHEFVRRYNRNGNPPQRPTCTILRWQGTDRRKIFEGLIESCSVDDHIATFNVISIAGNPLKRRLPVITASRTCPYILYGAGCKVPRTVPFRQVTTVASHDGRTVVVSSIGAFTDHYAQGGELLHISSGERMTISDQVGATLTLQLALDDIQNGDTVHVFAGCDHNLVTCRDKFDNLSNFGGAPELPRGNIFLPNGVGIYQSE